MYNQSFSYLAETPASAGPIRFLFNLWQAAQFALNKDLPLAISTSWEKELNEREKRRVKSAKNLETVSFL